MTYPHAQLIDAHPVTRFSPAIFKPFFEEARLLFSIFCSGQAKQHPNVRCFIAHDGRATGTEMLSGQVEISGAEFKRTLCQ